MRWRGWWQWLWWWLSFYYSMYAAIPTCFMVVNIILFCLAILSAEPHMLQHADGWMNDDISPEGYEQWHPHNWPVTDNQPPTSTTGQSHLGHQRVSVFVCFFCLFFFGGGTLTLTLKSPHRLRTQCVTLLCTFSRTSISDFRWGSHHRGMEPKSPAPTVPSCIDIS